jgi:glycosyltransferase involved in cell wall biosynthesis
MVNALNALWITWEHQRRSIVLSKVFETSFYELNSPGNRLVKYLLLCIKTVRILIAIKPDVLFVQNPSIVLTFIACLYKKCFPKVVLVVDRHSNFFEVSTSTIINRLHTIISNVTLRSADLTIVTNAYLKQLVESYGGNALVLEDKIPELKKNTNLNLPGTYKFLYVCSFDSDEPYSAVIEAARRVGSDMYIYITGNYRKIKDTHSMSTLPQNLVMLGYLPDDEYIDYLYAADAVIALTTWEHTLLCGAYEAVAAGKPLIISNKSDLIGYFNKGVIPVENTTQSLAQAMRCMIEEKQVRAKEIITLKTELNEDWKVKYSKVYETINALLLAQQRKGV